MAPVATSTLDVKSPPATTASTRRGKKEIGELGNRASPKTKPLRVPWAFGGKHEPVGNIQRLHAQNHQHGKNHLRWDNPLIDVTLSQSPRSFCRVDHIEWGNPAKET